MPDSYDLISAREHYLSQPLVHNFCCYLALYLNGKEFSPHYTTELLKPRVNYVFVDLEDAYRQYRLEKDNEHFFIRSQELRPQLLAAMREKNLLALISTIQEIFGEKHILKNNLDWFEEHGEEVFTLIDYACQQLTEESPDFDAFGRPYGPRMSAFLSRLYALLLGSTISYDSRISAGLCLFIREFCITHQIALPQELSLARLQGWGKGKTENGRNASWGDNQFKSVDRIKKRPLKERTFAQSVIHASWLVNESIRLARQTQIKANWLEDEWAIRKVEAAFYMMGTRLPTYVEGQATF